MLCCLKHLFKTIRRNSFITLSLFKNTFVTNFQTVSRVDKLLSQSLTVYYIGFIISASQQQSICWFPTIFQNAFFFFVSFHRIPAFMVMLLKMFSFGGPNSNIILYVCKLDTFRLPSRGLNGYKKYIYRKEDIIKIKRNFTDINDIELFLS